MPHLSAIDWDYADRMRHVEVISGQDVYFNDDAAGQGVRKVWITNAGTWRRERIYLGGYELWRKYNLVGGSWVLQDERDTVHISDDSRRICMVETLTWEDGAAPSSITPRFRFQFEDHLGTAGVETDQTGAIISMEEFHPYGTSSYRSWTGGVEVSAKRYRYTGKERDEETSLYYHGARYYAPWLGRWMSADPAGTVDGTNLFAYVRGSPVVLSDPSGMAPNESQPLELEFTVSTEQIARLWGGAAPPQPAESEETIKVDGRIESRLSHLKRNAQSQEKSSGDGQISVPFWGPQNLDDPVLPEVKSVPDTGSTAGNLVQQGIGAIYNTEAVLVSRIVQTFGIIGEAAEAVDEARVKAMGWLGFGTGDVEAIDNTTLAFGALGWGGRAIAEGSQGLKIAIQAGAGRLREEGDLLRKVLDVAGPVPGGSRGTVKPDDVPEVWKKVDRDLVSIKESARVQAKEIADRIEADALAAADESGRHTWRRRAGREIERLAKRAQAEGALDELVAELKGIAKTYLDSAEGHRGGISGRGRRR
ncbi:MAG: RHS repeat-associated core domain-containing protein [Polyangiaceae bacterium]